MFKAYRHRRDAEDAYNRTMARNAVRRFEYRDEAAHGTSIQSNRLPFPASCLLFPVRRRAACGDPVPFYARDGVSPMHADAIVVFRGRSIGVFFDW